MFLSVTDEGGDQGEKSKCKIPKLLADEKWIIESRFRNVVHYIMLLLTNCEVHTGKYSDRSLDVRTERKTKDRIFSRMDRTNWSIRALLYSHNLH